MELYIFAKWYFTCLCNNNFAFSFLCLKGLKLKMIFIVDQLSCKVSNRVKDYLAYTDYFQPFI